MKSLLKRFGLPEETSEVDQPEETSEVDQPDQNLSVFQMLKLFDIAIQFNELFSILRKKNKISVKEPKPLVLICIQTIERNDLKDIIYRLKYTFTFITNHQMSQYPYNNIFYKTQSAINTLQRKWAHFYANNKRNIINLFYWNYERLKQLDQYINTHHLPTESDIWDYDRRMSVWEVAMRNSYGILQNDTLQFYKYEALQTKPPPLPKLRQILSSEILLNKIAKVTKNAEPKRRNEKNMNISNNSRRHNGKHHLKKYV